MTQEQIKNYLEKYRINSEEQLAKHIEELKRNTIPNNEIIFPLVDMLVNEKSVLNSFFAENKKIKNPMIYLDEVLVKTVKKEQQIIKDWNSNSTNENTFLVFTTLERELASDKELHLSTRHKSKVGETHIIGDISKPKNKEISLKELKENTINDMSLGLDMTEITGVVLCDSKEFIHKLIKRKIAEKEELPPHTKEYVDDYMKSLMEIHTGLSDTDKKWFKVTEKLRKTTPKKPLQSEFKNGVKETEGKLDYSEINFRLLDLMAKRFMDNKHKYPKGNTLKVINKEEILWAAFRHIRKMLHPIKDDTETYEDHLAAVATNMSIILDQLKNQ